MSQIDNNFNSESIISLKENANIEKIKKLQLEAKDIQIFSNRTYLIINTELDQILEMITNYEKLLLNLSGIKIKPKPIEENILKTAYEEYTFALNLKTINTEETLIKKQLSKMAHNVKVQKKYLTALNLRTNIIIGHIYRLNDCNMKILHKIMEHNIRICENKNDIKLALNTISYDIRQFYYKMEKFDLSGHRFNKIEMNYVILQEGCETNIYEQLVHINYMLKESKENLDRINELFSHANSKVHFLINSLYDFIIAPDIDEQIKDLIKEEAMLEYNDFTKLIENPIVE
jgi:hypothetical protein